MYQFTLDPGNISDSLLQVFCTSVKDRSLTQYRTLITWCQIQTSKGNPLPTGRLLPQEAADGHLELQHQQHMIYKHPFNMHIMLISDWLKVMIFQTF